MPPQKEEPKKIRIEGWFLSNTDKYPDLDKAVLDPDLWKISVRDLNLENLRILEMHRAAGRFWRPIYVCGVVDTLGPGIGGGPPVPFFIQEEKIRKLKKLLKTIPPKLIL
jgi:hypothetical protein